jgi:hypothetical protein
MSSKALVKESRKRDRASERSPAELNAKRLAVHARVVADEAARAETHRRRDMLIAATPTSRCHRDYQAEKTANAIGNAKRVDAARQKAVQPQAAKTDRVDYDPLKPDVTRIRDRSTSTTNRTARELRALQNAWDEADAEVAHLNGLVNWLVQHGKW